MNVAFFGLIESAPPVWVSEYAIDGLPFASSLTTLLLSFCASSNPPSSVPTMPSPLLPSSCQRNFHVWPAAITPGIASLLTSRTPAAGAGPRPPPAAPRPPPPPAPRPRAGGGVLHIDRKSTRLNSSHLGISYA